jgi:hypothetical protein
MSRSPMSSLNTPLPPLLHAMRARKEKKYLERCAGVGFTALAFDTLGAAHPATVEFLGEVKEANRRDVSDRCRASGLSSSCRGRS